MTTFKDFTIRAFDWYKRRRICVNFIILAIIYLLCCFFEYASPVAFAFLAFFVFTEKNYGGYYYLAMSLPFINILVFADYVFVVPIVGGLYIIYTFIRAFLVEKGKINIVSLMLLILLEGYMALPIVNSYDLVSFAKMGLVLILFMFLEFFRKNGKIFKLKNFIYSYMFGFAIGTVFTFVFPFAAVVASLSKVSYYYASYLRFQGFTTNPNIYSLYCIFALFCPIYLFFNEKYKVFSVAMLLFVIICGILSLSKTFMILGAVWILFVIIKFFTLNTKKALIVAGVIAGIFLLSFLCFKPFVMAILTRFFSATRFDEIIEFDWSEILTFRNDLWGNYLTVIFQDVNNVFFGFGLSAPCLTGDLNPTGLNPHNNYIAIIYKIGLVGFALFCSLLIYMIIQVYKGIKEERKIDWLTYILFVVAMMWLFVEDFMF